MNEVVMEQQDVGQALTPEQQMLCEQLPGAACWADAARFLRIDIAGELDVARLQAAFDQVLAQQPMLLARLAKAPGFHGLRQFSAAAERFPLTVQNAAASEADIQAQLTEWAQRAFLPGESAGAQAVLYALPEQRWALVLGAARHSLDDNALTLVYQQLLRAYEQCEWPEDEESGEFGQYLEWRSEVILDEDAATARAYWQAQLNGVDATLSTPWLAARESTVSGADSASLNKPLDASLVAGLEHLAQTVAQPVTVLMQSVWWLLLARLSGRDEVLMGWRHDGREDYEYFSGAIGVFEKTLPLNLPVEAERSFAQWLPTVAARLEEHRLWQEYWAPELQPAAARPAYGFALHRQAQPVAIGATRYTAQPVETGRGGVFELLLQVQLNAENVASAVALEYAAQRYSAASMQALLDQYITLLGQLVADANVPLRAISLLSEAERQRLLSINPSARAWAETPLLPQRIAEWARSTPEALALTDEAGRLNYAQLQAQVERLAAGLHAEGVGRDSVVALALPRSAALVVAMLAIWRVGAAYLPLDRQWPLARQQLMLEQARAGLLLTDATQIAEWPGSALPVRSIDQLLAADAASVPAHETQGSDLAYVLFTSGSTGTPKGVLIEHQHLLNYTASVSSALGLDGHRHFGLTSTVAADLGNTTLFGALFNGAALHVASDEQMQDAQAFAGYVQARAVDCLKIVPSHLAALLDSDTPRLPRTLVLGGEAIAAHLIQRIAQVRSDCQVFNHYGPTETTVGVMVHKVAPGQGAGLLSQVLDNNQVYVLDAQQQLAPVGVVGELYVGGAQLFRGYVNVEAEAGLLIDNPFISGERLYRTGDLARYLPERAIVLHGRRDHQIKVRGFRIELTEVEAQLLRQPSVQEAVVIAGDSPEQGLQAFVVARESLAADSLREQLAQQLPAVMVPQQIRFIERLPRLANGKIDRKALQQLADQGVDDDYVAPRDALETLLAGRMAQLLGQDRLSIERDFFAAGGHSLLVIKLVAGIRKLLQCEIHPGVVFDHPTVAGLAQALRGQEASPGQLDKLAQARVRLESMSPEEKALLTEKARQLQAAKVAQDV